MVSNIIHLLPDAIANQIAAGEVVQRPASVVKELLENAVDAGATSVQLIVKEGGKTLVQVIDDGSGMSETDARMSFERHATSKIRKSEDLFTIRTMGFRGEALASIAAVAQVEVRTRPAQSELGTLLRVEGSEVKAQEVTVCPPGTNFLVKNLFFNVPARRNFLKSNSVEMRHVLDEFQRIALAHPDRSFALYQNDLEAYNLPAGKLAHRIVDLFGKNYREQLAACQEDTPFVKITGYIGKPEFAKRTRGEQFFFVNQRFVRHNYLHHAVVSAFEGLIPADAHPFYVLFLEIDPVHIDVNVHPTKTEVKFDDERTVYSIVLSAVKRAMGLYNITPALDFQTDVNFTTRHATDPEGGSWLDGGKPAPTARQKTNQTNWAKLYDDFQSAFRQEKHFDGVETNPRPKAGTIPRPSDTALPPNDAPSPAMSELPTTEVAPVAETAALPPVTLTAGGGESFIVQLHQRFVLAQVRSGLLLIDQQAAHERILYERYQARLRDRNGASQQLLFPQTLVLSQANFHLMREIADEVRSLGFVLEPLGHNTLVVYGIPTDAPVGGEQDLLEGLIEQFKAHESDLKLDARENLARALARRSASKAGTRLSPAEMNTLIEQLFATANPHYAPNGAPTMTVLALDKLAALLK